MKTIILFIGLAFTPIALMSQNFNELANYNFKSADQYQTEQGKVLECANYLFDNPADKAKADRLTAIQFIMKWMEGTPDYTFEIGKNVVELTNGNSDLLGLYLAAMTKVALDNSDQKLSSAEIYNQSEAILIGYCSKPSNNIKPSKKIKKLLKAKRS